MENQKALIVVDLQNDFLPGGSLGVPEGNTIIPTINLLVAHAEKMRWVTVYSRDWHPEETPHFDKWPVHCVQNTKGAEFSPALTPIHLQSVLSKGMGELDGYSAFEHAANIDGVRGLNMYLARRIVKQIFVCGLATDYCVKDTVIDGIKKGFIVYLVTDAIGAVNKDSPEDGANAIAEMQAAGAILTTSKEITNN